MARKGQRTSRATEFTSTNQPANRGRKKSRMTQFMERWKIDGEGRDIARGDFCRLLGFLLTANAEEIERMNNDDDLPVSIKAYIQGIMDDIDEGRINTIEKLVDRVYGAATQTINVATEGKKFDLSALTDEQKLTLLNDE